ncbi:MAG: hypothetical protein UV61_C0007G0002 [Candidatus Gottesmanbacteria bacterium GW2011_GWB1_43_11]|uniref:Uncharacterized protein n=1 Tax=Candidatus Gottesmanbacteria bacterium GW2011_GWB1_43_11 TaxID=1618446 RepID=A0A0G1CMJ6_9BACT|nr:MAG: hypothetical protein UV17_C0006G0030 [Candidatus Gottesmanbacteria bacterium GW2011_GWA1_42_26]KKS86744.1 MAG: hypothetical protein UV61_C0007G0002 [Candidatus Gottesmanbacteria bacterium GW2011_GWB1_43_11]OGG09862.1 MAG: hypothetical protein A2699_00675 [Candidatus Gottesmanbacteria bacterium RIFCSPHIGHO2_01_FULL_43_15]OGG25278.1 MAG: hypothetical protein A3A59_00395 [Candidatus Gottesmanbacteria bacterium RIFCSPLOWO2_01_FULL_42_10]HCM37399.1 hypothetical protein [Patescibacteria group
MSPKDPCLFLDVAQISCLEPLFGRVVSIVAALAGIIFFVMLIVGGFRYLFSAGNPKATEAAKGTITAAFLGIFLIVGAYLILRLIAVFTGITSLTTFQIFQF